MHTYVPAHTNIVFCIVDLAVHGWYLALFIILSSNEIDLIKMLFLWITHHGQQLLAKPVVSFLFSSSDLCTDVHIITL